jgi:two-component system sensor histidine kinase MtrB
MLRSFRTRVAVTIVVLVAATAALVAVLSFTLVQRSLRNQLIDAAVDQADFNLGVLATTEVLPADADLADFEASGLAARFLQRGSDGLYVQFSGSDETYASSFELNDAGTLLAQELRDLVVSGRFGYQFLTVGDEPRLIVGARRPPAGPDFYFVFSAATVDDALAELRRVLIAAGAGVAVLGVLVAGLITRHVLRPIRSASTAAGAMAAGDLTVRIPEESSDELGRWAASFNQMAASLQGRVGELQEARAREQRFVADVSHELRTPLTALVAEAEMLSAHLDDLPGPVRRVGELLSDDVERLRRLVQDLLEISRLEASPAAAEPSDVDVAPFLAAVIADRLPAATLRCDVGGPVRTDRVALERIVGNLLDNAARHAPGADVLVRAFREDGVLAIDVADTGPGVPAAALPLLFDRFYSADASRHGGSGLGLAIARHHATRLGGGLSVRPNEPSGLVFELRVPVTESLPGGDGAEKPASQAEGETSQQGGDSP